MNDSIAQVWMEYLRYHPRAILTAQRERLIQRRLDEYPVETLIDAIRGNHLDPFCSGENDRLRAYHGIGLILRDADHIERYAEMTQVKPRTHHQYEEPAGEQVPPPADLVNRFKKRA